MKLEPNEVLVKDFKIIESCLGTKKTNTRLMLTFTKEQKDFEFVDVFLTTEQAIQLRDDLEYYLHGEYLKR